MAGECDVMKERRTIGFFLNENFFASWPRQLDKDPNALLALFHWLTSNVPWYLVVGTVVVLVVVVVVVVVVVLANAGWYSSSRLLL